MRPEARRRAVTASAQREARSWKEQFESISASLDPRMRSGVGLAAKLEELRHRIETLATKARGLAHHSGEGWKRARVDYLRARNEVSTTWRTLLGLLEREAAPVR
ncbi:hypothetical protein Pla86_51750 [Planctomycetes bacterium Pla86]|uniref:Uncharacterized protein n=2 Tax=Engelhardtia mirabilis TaxID=2528011 RepID=A0A518BSW9_9BACT|nr:hypothetical protein Pla133_51780 [Planctomycetes bacterium Pla133]QDV04380.1 hypothetical protein Pla86_51750 [Planctomycetes bacterium Pla86]